FTPSTVPIWGLDGTLGVLGSNNHLGYWIPSPDEFSANAEKDMIAHLIVEFKLPVAEILIDYCLARAHSTDPMLLEKLMISVPHLIPKHLDCNRFML
ncbi:hypothetical protein BGZ54_005040, partial [Gamsiella multidivaricata]